MMWLFPLFGRCHLCHNPTALVFSRLVDPHSLVELRLGQALVEDLWGLAMGLSHVLWRSVYMNEGDI